VLDPSAAAPLTLPDGIGALLAAIGGAMIGVHFTYDGYADAVYLAGETRDPGRTMPRVLFAALGTITLLYLFANAAFLGVLGTEGLARSKFPALDVVRVAFGAGGAAVLTVVAVVVMLGAVNAYFLTGPRIARVLAEEGLALPVLGRMSAHGASAGATIWIAGVASLFVLTGSFGDLLAIVVPTIAVTTIAVAAGLLVQRARAPERVRPFRTPWAWPVALLQAGLGSFLLLGFAQNNITALAIDLGALVVGLLVYVLVVRKRVAST
jgi:basic amino acid/polyamine antiporter, APA family